MSLPPWWSSLFKDLQLLAGALRRVPGTADLSRDLELAISRARPRADECPTDESSGRRYREIVLSDLGVILPLARQLHPPGTELFDTKLRIIYACYEEIDSENSVGCADIDRIRRAR
jgi:hypothetical protein